MSDKVRRCATIMDGDRHEYLQADGSWGRCGGPGYCRECNRAAGPTDERCPYCGGAGERFDHADDCDSDSCALNGDIDSCNGQVVACHCAETLPAVDGS